MEGRYRELRDGRLHVEPRRAGAQVADVAVRGVLTLARAQEEQRGRRRGAAGRLGGRCNGLVRVRARARVRAKARDRAGAAEELPGDIGEMWGDVGVMLG